MRVYSCYFSPNDPFEIFEIQILLLEKSFREASGRSLIVGDFNSKSLKWGEARLDRRERLVGEMAARNDLIVLNQGRDFTFRRGVRGSIIDLTFAAPRLASTRTRAYWGLDVLVERPVVCPASKMPYSAAEISLLKGRFSATRGMEKRKIRSMGRHKENPTSEQERPDRLGREGPMGSRLQNSHKEIGG